MPRKKEFDVDEAIRASMEVFWRKGYDGTSVDDLIEATGVKRQSLYNALGEKRDMFMKALLKYESEELRQGLKELESTASGRGSIEYLFTTLVEQCSKDKARRGCFLVNTALEASHGQDIQSIVGDAIGDFEAFFRRSLRRAQKEGDIHSSLNVPTAASGLLGTYFGIRVVARTSQGGKLIKNMAKHALQSLDA